MAIDTKTVRLDPTASSEAATKDLVAAVSKHQLADLDVSHISSIGLHCYTYAS